MKYRGEAVSDPVTQGANQNQFGDCPETTLETRLELRPLFLSAFSILPFTPLSLQLIDRVPTLWQWRRWSIPKVRRGGCRCRTDCIVYTSRCVVGHPHRRPERTTHTCCLCKGHSLRRAHTSIQASGGRMLDRRARGGVAICRSR